MKRTLGLSLLKELVPTSAWQKMESITIKEQRTNFRKIIEVIKANDKQQQEKLVVSFSKLFDLLFLNIKLWYWFVSHCELSPANKAMRRSFFVQRFRCAQRNVITKHVSWKLCHKQP